MSAKMIENPNKLLPAAELRRLRIGSYEEKIGEAAAVARALLGETPFQIMATRENDTVIYTDGKFFRMELREEGPALSELDVEIFEGRSVRFFVEREAQHIADLFLRGDVERAVSRLENLVPSAPILSEEDETVVKIEAGMAAPRPWLRLYASRQEHIFDFLGEAADAIETARLRPKFGKLYDGSIEEDDLSNYKNQVSEDLEAVVGRLEQARVRVKAALLDASELLAEPTGDAFDALGQFAVDLYSDLCALHEVSSHAMTAVDDICVRGKLCDTIVDGLYDREIASHFVAAAANRMVEAN